MREWFKENQFYLTVAVWFVFTYIILWFIGGGCLDPLSGGTCVSSEGIKGLSTIPFVNLLLPFNQWFSLMYWVAPLAGFVFAFFAIRWYNEYYETAFATSLWFVVLILAVLFIGYYINVSWYVGEAARLSSNANVSVGLYICITETTPTQCNTTVSAINQQYQSIAQSSNASVVKQFIPIAYWQKLKESIYLTFIIGALLAWVPLFVQRKLLTKQEN